MHGCGRGPIARPNDIDNDDIDHHNIDHDVFDDDIDNDVYHHNLDDLTGAPGAAGARGTTGRRARDPLARVLAAYQDTIPDHWKALVPVHYELGADFTSLSFPDGLESISTYHANGAYPRLQFVIGHEFGHEIAFRFGSGAYYGAPPDGWPGPADPEAWADCVGVAFTGRPSPIASHQCAEGPALDYTINWLATH